MAWITPKTDWAASDAVAETDFNRIEGDILLMGGNIPLRHKVFTGTLPSGANSALNNTGIDPSKVVRISGVFSKLSPTGNLAWWDISNAGYFEVETAGGFSGFLMVWTCPADAQSKAYRIVVDYVDGLSSEGVSASASAS
jgi:hypothetical protein